MRVQPTPIEQNSDFPDRPRPPARRGHTGLYVGGWAILALLAVGYLAVLLLQPEWARSMTAQTKRNDASEQAARTTMRIITEVESLRRTVADLQRDLAHVKIAANARQASEVYTPPQQPVPNSPAEQTDRESQLKLAPSITDRAPAAPSPAPAERNEAQPANAAAGTASSKKAADVVVLNGNSTTEQPAPTEPVRKPAKMTTAIAAKPVDKARTTEPARTSEAPPPSTTLETGSLPPVPKPRIAFGPATVTPTPDALAIVLDSGPSLDILRAKWNILHDRHPSALSNLEPRYVVGGSRGARSYQLIAGPVPSADEAVRICALLNARNVGCSIGPAFGGNAL